MAEKLCDLQKKAGISGASYDFTNATLLTNAATNTYTANCAVGDVLIIWFRGDGTETLTATGGTVVKTFNGLADPLFLVVASATTVTVTSSNSPRSLHVAKIPKS